MPAASTVPLVPNVVRLGPTETSTPTASWATAARAETGQEHEGEGMDAWGGGGRTGKGPSDSAPAPPAAGRTAPRATRIRRDAFLHVRVLRS